MFDFSEPITGDVTLEAEWNCLPAIDTSVKSFENLKKALQYDNPASLYGIGTKFSDTYNYNGSTSSFTWRVAHYGKATNSAGQSVDGVYLFMNATPHRMTIGSNTVFWGTDLQKALEPNGSIYNCFSSAIKSYTIDIQRDYRQIQGYVLTPEYVVVSHTSKFGAIGAVECGINPSSLPAIGSQFKFDFFKSSNAATYRTLWPITSSNSQAWCTRDVESTYAPYGSGLAIALYSASSSGEVLSSTSAYDIASSKTVGSCGITVFIPKD